MEHFERDIIIIGIVGLFFLITVSFIYHVNVCIATALIGFSLGITYHRSIINKIR